MLITTLAFFSLAAILGILLLAYVLGSKPTPKGLAFIHGAVAAIGIILLIFYSFVSSPKPLESLTLFIIAALGGFILIFRDLTGRSIPKWFAIVHGLVAVTAFIFLVLFFYNHWNLSF